MSKLFLDIKHVYNEVPEVYDELSFYVPCEKVLHVRGAQIGDKTYKLWSPNSESIDYYPGAPLKGLLVSYDTTSCYPDGKLGPHDWSLHPQHFYDRRPWLPFCQAPPTHVLDWCLVSPELIPLGMDTISYSTWSWLFGSKVSCCFCPACG